MSILKSFLTLIETEKFISIEDWIDNVLLYESIKPNRNNLTFNENYIDSAKEAKDSYEIYLRFIYELKKYMDKKELTMFNAFKMFYDNAYSIYDKYLSKKSSLNTNLPDKQIILDTLYGKITFKFISKLNFPTLNLRNSYFAHDDETNTIYIFTETPDILEEDLAKLFTKRNGLLHELKHAVDYAKKRLNSDLDYTNEIPTDYVNHPDEFRAFSQQIICDFGRYIAKNHTRIKKNKLNNQKYIEELFKKYLSFENPDYKRRINEYLNFQNFYNNLNSNNKKEFIKQLSEYLFYIQGTDKDIDYSIQESFNRNNLIKLINGELYFKRKII